VFELNFRAAIANPFTDLLISNRRRYTATSYLTTEVFPADDSGVNTDVRAAFYNSNDFSILKYGNESPSYVNWQLYRLSDILLIKAEALNFSGFPSEALTLVKELRQARNASTKTDRQIDPLNPDPFDVGGFILDERSREFAFEGKRWYDILRFTKRNNYASENQFYLSDMVLRTIAKEFQQATLNKYRDQNSHYFPIHQDELFTDLTLTQNPFYSK
jgi:starch-binding outer membrane protein, SusD/RagB family